MSGLNLWDDPSSAVAPTAPVPAPNLWEDSGPASAPGQTTSDLRPQDWMSKTYHPILEGGAVTAGSMAGGAIGTLADPIIGPAGTLAGAAAGAGAFYPAGKYVADAIDRIRGIATEQQSLTKQMEEGAKIELEGQTIGAVAKPVLGAIGNILPGAKAGEALSGTPANNLSRASKNGFVKTFFSPMPMEEASEQYGDEFNRLMGDHFTPQQQADLLLNPTGMAKDALDTAIQKSIRGESLTTQEAIAAKRGIDIVMPAGTAKNLPRIRGFSDFDTYLNHVISEQDPAFKAANDNYAASKLRSQLLMFGMVNKSNPNEYSKLGQMIFDGMGIATGIGTGSFKNAALAAGSQVAASPFVMGLISAANGTGSRLMVKALENPLIQRSVSSAVNDYFNQNGGTQQGTGGTQ